MCDSDIWSDLSDSLLLDLFDINVQFTQQPRDPEMMRICFPDLQDTTEQGLSIGTALNNGDIGSISAREQQTTDEIINEDIHTLGMENFTYEEDTNDDTLPYTVRRPDETQQRQERVKPFGMVFACESI